MKYFVSGLQKHQTELYNVAESIFDEACDGISFPENFAISIEFMSENEYKDKYKKRTTETFERQVANFVTNVHKQKYEDKTIESTESDSEDDNLLSLSSNDFTVAVLPISLKASKAQSINDFTFIVAHEASFIKFADLTNQLEPNDEYNKILNNKMMLNIILAYWTAKLINKVTCAKDVYKEFILASDVIISKLVLSSNTADIKRIIETGDVFTQYLGVAIALDCDIHSEIVDRLNRESRIGTNLRRKLFGDTCVVDTALSKKTDARIKQLNVLKDGIKADIINQCDNKDFSIDTMNSLYTNFNKYVAELY